MSISTSFNHNLANNRGFNISAVIGCDGYPTNTGINNGVIRLLEEDLDRPLHWFICQIHGNELSLKNLFQHYDGRKTGLFSFAGPISKIIDCENLLIVEFDHVQPGADLQEGIESELSSDQQYFLQICKVVASGECSEEFANKKPGKVS